jgi:biotin carboxyl carrier protein
MKYVVTINNKSYEVEVEKGQANILRVEDVAAQAAVQAAQNAAAAASPQIQQPAAPAPQPKAKPAPAPSAAVPAGGEQVKSPMPGTILDVRVTSGQTVKQGDILFILEAMKMENEIMAPVDGTVQVVTSKGASVSTGDVLASIQ